MRFVVMGLLALLPSMAQAADLCEAVAIREAQGVDGVDSLKKGEFDPAITQYNVEKKTGRGMFCSHGGYCYYTQVRIDGKQLDSLLLINCKVGEKSSGVSDADQDGYDVVLDPERIEPKELAMSSASDKLMKKGLPQIIADSAARAFVYKPDTKCGRVTALALSGNKLAVEKLNDGDDFHCD